MEWTSITRRQGGLVTHAQLAALGLTRNQIERLRRNGRLESTQCQALYRAAGAPFASDTPAWFAVLASASPLSFHSAAEVWELPVEGDGLVHITRLDRRRLAWPAGVRVHRVGLRRTCLTHHHGLPVTTRVETIIDWMGAVGFSDAVRLADRAVQQRWLTPADVEARLRDQPGRWGNRQLRRILPQLGDGAAAESERRLHRLLRDAGISGWQPNRIVTIDGVAYEVDVIFSDVKLAIEVDGRRYHSQDERFQNDRTKQNALVVRGGWTVLRFTWWDITENPHAVIAQIQQALATLAA